MTVGELKAALAEVTDDTLDVVARIAIRKGPALIKDFVDIRTGLTDTGMIIINVDTLSKVQEDLVNG